MTESKEVFVEFYSRGEDTPFFRVKTNKKEADKIIENNIQIYEGNIEAFIEDVEEVKNAEKS